MIVNAILGVAIPVALAWWLVKKYKANIVSILIGAGVFFVFALVLESIVHQIVLRGLAGASIMGNPVYYGLYGGLMAGLFEETGRFIAMKFLMKKEPSTALPGIAYGAGHGGIEMIMIFALGMVSSVAMALLLNSGQADMILSKAPAEAQEQVLAQFQQLQDSKPGTFFIGLWERLSALVLQIGLSIIVWTAVRKGGKWLWLFPAAILIHAFVDFGVVLMQKSVSMVVIELMVMAEAIAVGAIGFMLAKKMNRKPQE